MKKKLVLSLAAAAMVGTLAVGGTLAWFTDTETATNVVTTGNVNISWFEGETTDDLVEITKDYEGMQFGIGEGEKPVVPGQNLDKTAVVRNEGKNPAYIRAEIVIEDGNGNKITDKEELALLKIEGTDPKWVKNADGYYYYQDIVTEKGTGDTSQTKVIVTDVKVKSTATNDDLANKNYKIRLVAEAVQSDALGAGVDTCEKAFGMEGLSISKYKEEASAE